MATSAERLKQYEDLFAKSQAYDTTKYQSDFEKAYNEAANYNKDLIEQKAQYVSQAQALPSQMREQYYSSPIRNPLVQESLIETRKGGLTGDISRIVDLLSARGARYQDILGKQTSAYESEAERAATAAENAWRLYQDVLSQEEAAKTRAASAAQAASLTDLFPTQQVQQQQTLPQEEELDITVPEEQSWSKKFVKGQTTPLSQTTTGKALNLKTPEWLASTPFGTALNLFGNLLGNIQVPKRQNQSFLDKLLNR